MQDFEEIARGALKLKTLTLILKENKSKAATTNTTLLLIGPTPTSRY